MTFKNMTKLFIFMLLSSNIYSDEFNYSEMASGACAISIGKDSNRLISFNERWSLSASYEQIVSQLNASLIKSNFSNTEQIEYMSVGFHCGGYGSSIITKFEVSGREYCAWFRPSGKSFELRSLGAVTNIEKQQSSDFCHGRKVGELILGLMDDSSINLLHDEELSKMINSSNKISDKTYKVIIANDYNFREDEVIKQLKIKLDKKIRYIEFNDYQHPVGDFSSLK